MAAKKAKKPRKSRRTGKPPGRPPIPPERIARGLERLDAGDAEGAVAASGTTLATLYRHRAKRDAGAAACGTAPPSPASGSPTPPVVAPAPAPAVPDATALEQARIAARAELLTLARRILDARDPAARRELDDGLLVAAQGEAPLVAWLARPLERRPPPDPLAAAAEALAAATACVEALPANSPRTATILGAAANLAKTVENIGKGRPREPTRDEVTERIEQRRDEAVRLIERFVAEAEAA